MKLHNKILHKLIVKDGLTHILIILILLTLNAFVVTEFKMEELI